VSARQPTMPDSLFLDWPRSCERGPSLAFDVAGGRGAPPTQKGDRVAFLLSDAFLPEAEEARAGQCREGEVEGTLLDFSDSGDVERAFAVVEVIERQTMVVPVEKLRALEKY